MIWAASAADWLLPPGSRNALDQPVNGAHPTDRPPGRLITTLRDAGHDPACSAPSNPTTAQPRATAMRRVPPTNPRVHSILASPKQGHNRGISHRTAGTSGPRRRSPPVGTGNQRTPKTSQTTPPNQSPARRDRPTQQSPTADLGTCQIRRKTGPERPDQRVRASRLKTGKAQFKARILFSSGTGTGFRHTQHARSGTQSAAYMRMLMYVYVDAPAADSHRR